MAFQINQFTLQINNTLICKDLNITIKPGEFWAVLGVNGVGKSTLLHHLINVDNASPDEIIIDDKSLANYKHHRKLLAQKTGILLQEYEYNFPCTVLDAALIGRHPYLSEWQWESNEDLNITENALKKTDLVHLKDRLTNTLSGGEKRRLNLATLLTQDPDYLLLDEPTNHLDLSAQIKILSFIREHIQNNDKAGFMVIHDANLANRYCDNVLLLYGKGEWASGSTKKMINISNLERLYNCPIQSLSNDNQSVFIAG